MNKLLTPEGNIGKDEFVTTPAPNQYMVTIRITPEQAEAFAGHERIMIHMSVENSGKAGVAEVYGVNDDNTQGDYAAFGSGQPNEAQIKVMTDTEGQVYALVKAFYAEVEDDLDDYYYEEIDHFAAALRDLLGR